MDSYLVDGVPLHDPTMGWYVMEGTELPSIGAPRNASVDVPTRNGVIAPATLSHGESTLSVRMMLTGAGGGRAGLAEGFDSLVRLVRSTTSITHELDEAMYSRSTPARLSSISTPEYTPDVKGDDPDYECTIVFDLPRGVWAEDVVYTTTVDDLTVFDGSGAALQDVELVCTPDEGRIVVTDGATGLSLTWEGDVVDDAVLHINPANCSATWYVGEDSSAVAEYDASGGLTMPALPWEIRPTSHGILSLEVSGTSDMTISARRGF